MEKKKQKEVIVVDVFNIPNKKRFKNKKLWNLRCVSPINAVFDMWEGNYRKVYVPKNGIPGYDFEHLCSSFNVKIEKY